MKSGALSSSSPTARTPTVDFATLPGLPTEVIIEIYKAADTFATAETLSKTSKGLHYIWDVHADAILSSVVECYPQAKELARVQNDNLARLPPCSLRQQPITTAHRICMNMNLTSSLLFAFEYSVIDEWGMQGIHREGLTPTQRADFVRASYRAMTLAAKDRCCMLHSIHEPLDMLEYMQMTEATRFLDTWFNPRNASPIHDSKEDSFDRAGEISRASRDLSLFHDDLMALKFDDGGFHFRHSDLSKCYFLLADGYQKKAWLARGKTLAELLPLLVAENGLYAFGRRCAAHPF